MHVARGTTLTSSAVNDAVSVALASGLALNGVLLYSFGSAWFRRGAPFVPTAQRKVDAIFHPKRGLLRALPRRRHMVDLGSGGGALVRGRRLPAVAATAQRATNLRVTRDAGGDQG